MNKFDRWFDHVIVDWPIIPSILVGGPILYGLTIIGIGLSVWRFVRRVG